MLNVAGCTEISLGVFGGNNLDMQPTDLPSGLSPDNSDCAFLPGSVFTRPAARRLLQVGTTSQVVYAKTFLKPDETVSQLTFTADGKMYQDGVQFGQTKAGNRFFAVNAFGKMYIATSDGSFGADVPLQLTPEGYLDRVSQDGPGGASTLANYAIPPNALVAGSAGTAVTITSATPSDPQQIQVGGGQTDPDSGYQPPIFETYFTELLVQTATAHGLVPGESVTITGNTSWNLVGYVVDVIDATHFDIGLFTQDPTVGTGGSVTPQSPLLLRSNNSVTATTATPHQLRAGYQVTIAGVADQNVGGSVSSIVIDNTLYPGLAKITTTAPNNLTPGEDVTLTGVSNVIVGTSIVNIVRNAGISTLTTTSSHGLQAGATVLIQTGTGPFLPFSVSAVISPTVFTYLETGLPDVTLTGGSVTLVWPGNQGTSQLYTVESVSDPNTFFISLLYSNGTWNSGVLTFAWNGTFTVTSILSTTSFTYQQTGPDAVLTSGTGQVIPLGRVEPGTRSIVWIFRTRTGYLTIPGPPASVICNGSQYLLSASIPIGPPNVIERWGAVTGANGGNYFVLPVPPRDPSGKFAIGTSTVIADNTTTSAIFDFSDESLFAGIAVDIPGNNLFRQQVLGPCLGFFSYASRLMAWGERNKIQQFLNMGFEGGIYAPAPNSPLGWTVTGSDGVLTSGDYGLAWQATDATISQPAYQDQNGIAIIQPNTQYTHRQWVNGTAVATLSSASTGFTATATVTAASGFAQADYSQKTPSIIPTDLIFTLSQTGMTTHDEVEIIYTQNPYILAAKVSYVNNPEAFDGVTGILGPVSDPHPVLGMEERKDVLCLLTSGPQGSLYETEQTPSGEPATWDVRHIASECGLVSIWGVTKFEDWFCWTADTGLRIFDGSTVDKMTQEIQPWWNSLNPLAKQFTVLANDPYTRRAYILGAINGATVTNACYVLDYRDLNTASTLANSGTLHISSYTGKTVTSDLTRKWSPWSMTMNYCGLLTLSSGEAVMAFCGGSGVALSDAAHGAVYELEEGVINGVDDDYGPFWQNSTYPTYFFISNDDAQQKQLGTHRLLHTFLTTNCTGVGAVYFEPNLDRMGNLGRPTRPLAVTEDLARDLEFGLNLAAERISYRICCQPAGTQAAAPNSPAGFRLSSMVLAVKNHGYSPIRGWNG